MRIALHRAPPTNSLGYSDLRHGRVYRGAISLRLAITSADFGSAKHPFTPLGTVKRNDSGRSNNGLLSVLRHLIRRDRLYVGLRPTRTARGGVRDGGENEFSGSVAASFLPMTM